ncbi:MAG: ATP-binding protein [Deltaproteobacteria bacterium]
MAKKFITDDRKKLRAEAEARFARDPPEAKPQGSTADLLHELQVHQIELEMQNEELRRVLGDLERTNERYVNLYEFAPVGYVTVSDTGTIKEVNLAGEPLFGVDRKLLQGSKFGAYVDPDDGDRWHLAFKKALTQKEKQSVAVRIRRADGATVHSWLEIVPVREEAEPLVRVALADITEYKRMEEELRALQAQVTLTSRLGALGTLVTGVAHEINNPLSAVMTNQGLALEVIREVRDRLRGGTPPDLDSAAGSLDGVVEALEDAQDGGHRIERVVKDLSTFGSPNAQRIRTRLIDVVQGSMRWLPATVAASVSIRVEDGGAPDVTVATGQLEQVIVNLITNAARAAREGERDTVIVRLGPGSHGTARLEVIDHGVGIPPAVLERIFDPFFTTRPTGEGRGTGMGLSICHAIVTAHGGTITVESKAGKGSTFRVELPAVPGEE